MKTKLFTLVTVMLFAGNIMATELLSIDFRSGQGDWTISNVELSGVDYVWIQNNTYGMKASAYYNKSNHATESWLISPTIDLSNMSTATMAFSHAVNYASPSEFLTVKASADGSNWSDLQVSNWPAGNNWTFVDAEAILNAFVGESAVQIAFVYTSSSSAAATWEIKTVKIEGEPSQNPEVDPGEVSYEHVKVGDLYYNFNATDKTAEVTYEFEWDSEDNNYKGLTAAIIPVSVTYRGSTYSVTSIGYGAFSGCTGLTSVTIPSSVTSIRVRDWAWEENAFSGCNNITSVVWNAKNCNSYNFGSQVTSFIFGEEVEVIPDGICSGMNKLTSIVIPNSVTRIEGVDEEDAREGAFVDCSGLASLTIGNSVTSIGGCAFCGCNINEIHYTGTIQEWIEKTWRVKLVSSNYTLYIGDEILHNLVIPDNVTSIGDGAFYGCNSLTSVTIPSSVTSIKVSEWEWGDGESAFSGCNNITSVVWNAKNCNSYNFGSQVTSFTFGEEVEVIPDGICSGMNKLTSIVIPNSVTRIGGSAFSGCSGLTSVTIPNSVTSIGGCAFCDCSSLTDIYATCGDLERVRELFDYESDGFVIYYDGRVKYEPLPYSITVNAENGYVNYPQSICDALELSAVPDYRYHFTQWSDGNTDNPRTIELTQDTTFIAEFAPNQYSINVSCDEQYGHIEGENGEFDYLTEKTYEAIPNYGYHFVRWSDGLYICDDGWSEDYCDIGHWEYNTNPQRTVTITQDTVITAIFEPNMYTVTPISNTWGNISGTGQFAYLTECTITANPNYGYHFVRWSDGETANPRTFVLKQDTIFAAEFAVDKSGICGDDLALRWEYDANDKVLTISGSGTLNSNYLFGVEAPVTMEKLVIAEGVTTIGNSAFAGFETLKHISIPTSVKTIYEQAFYNCSGLLDIYCYRDKPSVAYSNSFDGIDKFECTLHVLTASVDMYKTATGWRDFYYIQTIDAEAVTEPVEDVTVTPSVTTADVIWPAVENAVTYELTIKDKNGNVICTLVFNANGQLTSIAFGAPGRTQTAAQVAGFTFTVTGLDSGSSYGFRLDAKDSQGEVIDTKEGSFTTTESGIATAVDNASVDTKPVKVIRNGQLFILRGDKTYTVQGQEVR